jgi:hypothetical protein
MELERVEFTADEISVEPEEMLRLAGNPGGDLDRLSRQLVDQYTRKCRELSRPQGGYAWFASGSFHSEDALMLGGIRFQVGKIITRELLGSEAFALFAVTLGPGPESLARELIQAGDYLEGYLVDLIGSGMVESLTDQLRTHLQVVAARKGMKVTHPYSPGYCTWDVTEQQKLFGLMPEGWCGISLSESSLMSPIKSVSGIIGIGAGVRYRKNSCTLCPMSPCRFRKKPYLTS